MSVSSDQRPRAPSDARNRTGPSARHPPRVLPKRRRPLARALRPHLRGTRRCFHSRTAMTLRRHRHPHSSGLQSSTKALRPLPQRVASARSRRSAKRLRWRPRGHVRRTTAPAAQARVDTPRIRTPLRVRASAEAPVCQRRRKAADAGGCSQALLSSAFHRLATAPPRRAAQPTSARSFRSRCLPLPIWTVGASVAVCIEKRCQPRLYRTHSPRLLPRAKATPGTGTPAAGAATASGATMVSRS
jgi:hypothetical protein